MLQEQITLPVGAVLRVRHGERYRVLSLLGKGGFGAVYLISDRQTGQKVFALKEVINPGRQDRKRLLFECEILQRLDHKSLPRVYYVFENEKLKRVYLLMQYIKGKNLEELRQEQPGKRFPLDLTLSIMTPIVNALVYMHQQEPPVVHRDIKPANIIMPLDGNEAVLVDFGTAKEYIPEGTITLFTHVSPGFAAIEQYSPKSGTDLRTDVYGLGATLYTLLTGITPLDAVVRVMTGKKGDLLKPVSTLVPGIPKPVSDAIQRALAVYKEDRFPTVEALWQALHAESTEEQEQEQEPLPRLPDTPLPPIDDYDIESTGTEYSTQPPEKQQSEPFRERRSVPPLIVTFLLIVALLGILGLGFLLHAALPTLSQLSTKPTPGPRSSLPRTPHPLQSPTSTLASLYPPIAPSYAGEIIDVAVANTKTAMYLTQVRQDQDRISGDFQGLGLVGPFTGTVTSSGIIHLTVRINAGVLILDGNIKVGGDLSGSFKIVDQQGQSIGEYGIWSASISSGAPVLF